MSKRVTEEDMAELLGVDKRTYVNKEHVSHNLKLMKCF